MEVQKWHCLSLTHCVLVTLPVAWRLTEDTQQRCRLWSHYPALFSLSLYAHNFPLKACLASADCSTPSATVENYGTGGSRVSGNTVSVVPPSPPSPGFACCKGKESTPLFLCRLAWMLNFTLSQSSHRLLIERVSHTFPTGYPRSPQTSFAGNKYLQIPKRGGK